MANRYCKIGGSNLLDGTTLGNAWETAIYTFTVMGGSNTAIFSGTSGGVFDIDRSSLFNPIPSGIAGFPTVITDNADGVVTFHHPGSGSPGLIFFGNGPTRAETPEYITFEGTSANQLVFDAEDQYGTGAVIYLSNEDINHITFKYCEIKNGHASGILAIPPSDITFDSCDVHDCGNLVLSGGNPGDHGFYATGKNFHIINCNIYNIFGIGLSMYWTQSPVYDGYVLSKNRIFNNGYGGNGGGDGILLEGGSGIIANNVVFKNSGSGINVWRTSAVLIAHNTVHENGKYGIAAGLSSGVTANTQIKNNLVAENALTAIRIYPSCSGNGTTVTWNRTGSGETISTSADPSAIVNNNSQDAIIDAECVDASNSTLASRDYSLRSTTLTNSSGNWTVAVSSNIITIDTISSHGFVAGIRAIFDSDWTVNSFLASSSAVITSIPTAHSFTIAKTQSNQSATTETNMSAGIIGQALCIGGASFNEVQSAGIGEDKDSATRPIGSFVDQGAYESGSSVPPDAPIIGHESPYVIQPGVYAKILSNLSDNDSNTLYWEIGSTGEISLKLNTTTGLTVTEGP